MSLLSPIEFIPTDNDNRVSLTNLRRLDSVTGAPMSKSSTDLPKLQRQLERRNSCPRDWPDKRTHLTFKSRPAVIDETWREVEIDGWKSLVKTESYSGRIFWLIILIGCFAVLVWELVAVLLTYYNRPLSTSYDVVSNKTMAFPDVLVCPANGINWSVINAHPDLAEYVSFIKQRNVRDKTSYNYTILELKEKIMQFGYNGEQFMLHSGFTRTMTEYVPISDISRAKIALNYAKCFLIELGDRRQTIRSQGLMITFHLHKKLYPTDHAFSPNVDGVILRVGETVTYLRPGSHYNIDLLAEHLILINVNRGNVVRRCVGGGQNEFPYQILNRNSDNYTQVKDGYHISNQLPVVKLLVVRYPLSVIRLSVIRLSVLIISYE